MDSPYRTVTPPVGILLSLFSLDRLTAMLDLYSQARRWWRKYHPQGAYEILDYDSTLELLDARGEEAIFTKRQRVHFLVDHVLAFEDYAWGDGEIFAAYQVTPGVAADVYREGDRWNVLISLRESKKRGDVEHFTIERRVKDGFTQQEEWRQVEIRHPTRRLRMAVVFPAGRHCREASLRWRSRNRTIALGPQHFHALPHGRQSVVWETRDVDSLEIFTLRWRW